MPQIIKRAVLLFLLFSLLLWLPLLSGCGGSGGSDAGQVFVPESGHPANWTDPAVIGTDSFHGTSVSLSLTAPTGGALFSLRCAGCHGSDATGFIGPDITGRSSSDITTAVHSVPYMLWLGQLLTAEEIQALADYLVAPGTALSYSADANTCTQCHGSDLNGSISLIGCYACHNGPDGKVGHPDGWTTQTSDSVRFHGYYAQKSTTPCTACHGADLRGPLVPSCFSCHGTCEKGNCAPVAQAGPNRSVATGTVVTLNGTRSSDVDGTTVTYLWSFSSQPSGSTAALSDPASAQPSFTADAAGTYVISLVVSDGTAQSEADTVTITATAPQPTYSFARDIQPIFDASCTVCHSSGSVASFLPLTSDSAYSSLVNKAATRTGTPPSGTLVVPRNSAASVLYQRVSGTGLPAGESTMPLGGPSLSTADQNLIRSWIDSGAAQ